MGNVRIQAVVAGLGLASSALAVPLMYEPFAIGTGTGQYTVGSDLKTQQMIGGGSNWLAPTTGTSRTNVVTPGLSYTSAGGDTLATTGGAISWGWVSSPILSSTAARMQRSTIAVAAQSTFYASALVRIPAGGDAPNDATGALVSTAGSLIGFTVDIGAGASFRALGGGLKINKSGSTTTYTPTMFTTTATGAPDGWNLNPLALSAPAPSAVTYTETQTVLLVLKMESLAGNDRYTLYVNPTDLDAEPAAASASTVGYNFYTAPINPTSISLLSNVARREGTINSTSSFDEFRLGQSWGDVVVVPEPTMLGLLGTGALLLGLRRRRVVSERE